MSSNETKRVVENHIAALGAGDMAAVVGDYADDAVMISNLGGMTKGITAIGALFASAPSAGFADLEIVSQIYDGEIGYLVWKSSAIPLGSDTFVVRDGKITAQTVVMQVA